MSRGRKAAIAIEGQLKLCGQCKRELPLDAFNKGTGQFGKQCTCRECEHILHNTEESKERRRLARDARRKLTPEYREKEKLRHLKTLLSNEDSYKKYLVRGAKQRALHIGVPFDISYKDINIPEHCPLLGIKLNRHLGEGGRTSTCWDSPSIDRIIPELGYVKGNVWIVSLKANTIKNNATLEELELLVNNLKKEINEK